MILKYSVIALFAFVTSCYGLRCEKEGFLGIKSYKECPGPYDNPEAVFCCGDDDNPYCCSTPFDISEEDLEEITKKLPSILAGVAVFIVIIIITCVLCCCCCPFCLLYKRRTRGIVHNPPPVAATVGGYAYPTQNPPVMQPVQQTYAPVNSSTPAPYPVQPYAPGYPTAYPQQQAAAPYPAPTAAPYPAPTSAPYPSQPAENPPPYTEKQMAYNPNY